MLIYNLIAWPAAAYLGFWLVKTLLFKLTARWPGLKAGMDDWALQTGLVVVAVGLWTGVAKTVEYYRALTKNPTPTRFERVARNVLEGTLDPNQAPDGNDNLAATGLGDVVDAYNKAQAEAFLPQNQKPQQ